LRNYKKQKGIGNLLTFFIGINCFLLFPLTTTAQEIEWEGNYGGSLDDKAYSVQATDDGGYIMAGYSRSDDGDVSGHNGGTDFWVVKLDGSGSIEWEESYGGSFGEQANSIQPTDDGGYVVVGLSASSDGDVSENNGNLDYWVVKLDGSGNIEWEENYGGSGEDEATSIQATDDGGYIVAGQSNSNDGDVSGNNGEWDYWVVKLDDSGSIEWEGSYGGSDWDKATSIQATDDGGYIVVGESNSSDGDVFENNGLDDIWVIKLDSSGNIEWEGNYGGSFDEIAHSIQTTGDGGYIMAGSSSSNDGDVSEKLGNSHYWIVKLDSSGNIGWEESYGGSNGNVAESIQATDDGGYIVAGQSNSNDGDVSGNNGGFDYWVVKLDSSGNIEWEGSYGGSDWDRAYSIQATDMGDYIVAGYSSSSDGDVSGNNGEQDYWIVKLSGNSSNSGDTTPPASPTNLSVQQIDDYIDLSWDVNPEDDLAGYNVYRSEFSFTSKNEATQINQNLRTAAWYEDLDVFSGTTYYYAVTAIDDSGNESGLSNLESITYEDGDSDSGGNGDIILGEDFEDAEFPPAGWSMQTTLDYDLWYQFDHNDGGIDPADDQSSYMALADWTTENHDEWLITPEFSLSEVSGPTLIFYSYYEAGWVANATLKLNIRTEETDPNWVTIWEADDDGINGLAWRIEEVDLSDYTGLEQVQLAWQYVGADGYIMGIDNIEVSATDTGSGGGDEEEYPAEVTVAGEVTFGSASSSQDYRLVALPGKVSEPLSNVLPGIHGANWQAFWDDGSVDDFLIEYDNSETFNLAPGNGFWVTSTETFTYSETLPTVELNSQGQAVIPLHSGWNIISNPLDIDVAWSEVSTANGGSLQPAWGFDGSFSEASDFVSAKNGEAFYFLNDNGLEELAIPYVESSGKTKSRSNQQKLQLITKVDGQQTSSSSIVFADEDRPDVIAPPNSFEGASLRFTVSDKKQDNRTGSFARIYRKKKTQGKRFAITLTAKPGQQLTITAKGWDRTMSEKLVLLDPQTGKKYDLSSDIALNPEEETTPLMLVMGSSSFVREQQDEFLPKQVSVNPNYPNPFNPSTTLQFALPEQADVRVQVYDVLGRRVSTLIDEVREAGVHQVTFDASHRASGMYFAVFEIGGQRFVQKMTLIK
jgi:hypothetical protein